MNSRLREDAAHRGCSAPAEGTKAIDRAALEAAIATAKPYHSMYGSGAFLENMKTVIAAAEAHLATLPKTKTVEVWHVEFANNNVPSIVCFDTRAGADKWVSGAKGLPYMDCIKVTGPHSQCVPE